MNIGHVKKVWCFFFFDIFFVGGGCFLWGAVSWNASLSGYMCTFFQGMIMSYWMFVIRNATWMRLAGGFEYLWDSRLREDALKLGCGDPYAWPCLTPRIDALEHVWIWKEICCLPNGILILSKYIRYNMDGQEDFRRFFRWPPISTL